MGFHMGTYVFHYIGIFDTEMPIAMFLLKKSYYVTNWAYSFSIRRNKSVIGAYVIHYIGHVSKR